MIDMTLSELLAGTDLSCDEIRSELDAGKKNGTKPETSADPVVEVENRGEKPVEE